MNGLMPSFAAPHAGRWTVSPLPEEQDSADEPMSIEKEDNASQQKPVKSDVRQVSSLADVLESADGSVQVAGVNDDDTEEVSKQTLPMMDDNGNLKSSSARAEFCTECEDQPTQLYCKVCAGKRYTHIIRCCCHHILHVSLKCFPLSIITSKKKKTEK